MVVGRDLAGRVLSVLLLALVTVPAAWLLTPGSLTQRIPGPDALGTPAVGTIKAARDYDIPDEDTTARKREEAAAAERSVYDLDAAAPREAAARIHEAFETGRAAVVAAGGRLPVPEALKKKKGDKGKAEIPAAWNELRETFVNRLQLVVSEEDFLLLAEAKFAKDVEEALATLVEKGLAGMVAEDRVLLAAERERGLVARTVHPALGQPAPEEERIVSNFSLIRDTTQARDDVERSGAGLPEAFPEPLRQTLTRLAIKAVRPTLGLNPLESARRQREAAERVKPVVIQVKRGEKIIGDGERIEKRHLVIFNAIRAQVRERDLVTVRFGGGAVVALLVLFLWNFGRRSMKGFRPTRKDAVLLATLFLGTLGLTALGLMVGDALHDKLPALPPEAFYYAIPFAAGAMLIRSVLSAEVALLYSLAFGTAVGMLAGHSLFFSLYATLTSVVAADRASKARDRGGLFKVGVQVGLVGAVVVLAVGFVTAREWSAEMASSALLAFLGGALFLPVIVVGLLPLLEAVFGYVTDVKLLELANLNHPALKELIVQAPGTYHHSIIMGSLVEAGAQAIGANALLAKVSAYYHDIGKTRNPIYFAENQKGENRHDTLAPSMSALIIKRHVTDGIELARQYRLPRAVADAIPQHHGTRLVGFFWAKAQKLSEQARAADPAATVEPLEESHFRYAGPKPQTREAALVMVADCCEASARALDPPTPEKLLGTVQKRINEIFSEGQLDECDLTLRDLNAIAAAFVRALLAIHHTRPEYPSKAASPPADARPDVATVHRLRP
jgi:putative nucleotidyltransferase with HDIG domain